MFVDESGAWLGLQRTYARSAKGTRAVSEAPRRREGKVGLIAAITPQGLDPEQCLIHPGAVDTQAFITYLREVLVPNLRPGQVVFMDNFTIHHNKQVGTLIEGAGCYLAYLPTYSPDFVLDKAAHRKGAKFQPPGPVRNPIELVFFKVKAFLRKVGAAQAVTLIDAITQALATVLPHEVEACFNHCGYL